MKPRALMSWSSGKDSAWSLSTVQQAGDLEVVGLFTTLNAEADRVAMHAVRHEVLRRQADAAGLPLYTVGLPSPCTNEEYEVLTGAEMTRLKGDLGVTHMLFGDLFLEDIRAYRERQVAAVGLEPVFPLWQQPTPELGRAMIDGGLEAWLTCVDTEQLPGKFAGRRYDHEFLDALPEGVDPCGENGEFHTLVTRAPAFFRDLGVLRGELRVEPRFVFCDFSPF